MEEGRVNAGSMQEASVWGRRLFDRVGGLGGVGGAAGEEIDGVGQEVQDGGE
jgi:hypothetical protein